MMWHDSQTFDQLLADLGIIVIIEHGLSDQFRLATSENTFLRHIGKTLILIEERLGHVFWVLGVRCVSLLYLLDVTPRLLDEELPFFEAWLELEAR